jgi:putative ABC transport system permease protein
MWRRYLRFVRSDVREDVADEIGYHLEMRARELAEGGMDERSAREEALRHFGDRRRVERELLAVGSRRERRTHRVERLEGVIATVRYALRRIRRAPGFALAVVLTFALGIGANAVMFGIVDRLLLSPPAHVEEPGAVHLLMTDYSLQDRPGRDTTAVFSYPDYLDLTRAGSFRVAAISGGGPLTFGSGPEARQLDRQLVSGSFFSLLGVRPALGRFFGPEDDVAGAAGVAVISNSLWRNGYGRDPAVLGKTLDFGSGPYTIVGVAPPGFNGVELREVDLWLPMVPVRTQQGSGASLRDRQEYRLQIIARRARGVSPERMAEEAMILHRQGRAEEIASGRYAADVRILAPPLDPAEQGGLSGTARVAGWLLGISGLVLLIACANVANLLLARALRDRREIGIRLALGGSRLRILGQVVTESLLLAALGAVAALAVTRWGAQLLRAGLFPEVFWPESPVGGRVPALVLGLAVVAGLAAGLLPALQASRPGVADVLKSGASRGHTGGAGRARSALMVLQAMISVVLLVGAGLFVRSMQRVASLDLGFDPDGVLLASPVFENGVPDARRQAFWAEATRRLAAVPGVEQVSTDLSIPFWSSSSYRLTVPGLDSVPNLSSAVHVVEPGYFDLMRLRVLRGRALRAGDTQALVVNETMARALWPGEDAIGKCVEIHPDADRAVPCAAVVGVVENSRLHGLVENEAMHYYLPVAQRIVQNGPSGVLVRLAGESGRAIPALRAEMLRADPAVRYAEIQELGDLIDPEASSWRLGATVFSLFGLLALLVSGIGLYSVLAFAVAQRKFELGIRSALGAGSGDLVRLVVGQALRLVGIGIALGIAAALAAGGRIEPLLFQVSPRDPLVLAGVVLVLLASAVVAAVVPSRRALRVDPATALRAE